MKLDFKNNFVDELEKLYRTHLIYRTIVVCNDDLIEYKKLLEDKEFSVYIIDGITNINYDTLDYRILLIKSDLFEDFLSNSAVSRVSGSGKGANKSKGKSKGKGNKKGKKTKKRR